jgi:lipooligosaccharide transport system permease protein
MFLLSGTFFPLSFFPSTVQVAAQVLLPLTHAVNLSRGLILGHPDMGLLLSFMWIVAVTIVFFIISINLMKRRLIE